MSMSILLFVVFTGLLLVILTFVIIRKRSGKRSSRPVPPTPPPLPADPIPVAPAAVVQDLTAFEQKMRLEEEREFVFKLNERLSLSPDAASVARDIVNEARSFLSADTCVLFMYDARSGLLKAEAGEGVDETQFLSLAFNKGESIAGEVARTMQPVLVNGLDQNSFYSTINREHYLKRCVLGVPLVFRDELIGVISVADKKSGSPFRPSDQQFLLNVARVGAIAFKNCRLVAQMQQEYLNTITTLALLIDARDAYTKRHSENVTRYSVEIAKEMGFPADHQELIRRAGLLHDIGKIGIRDSILLKPGKLTDEEFEQIKSHAPRGADIVATLPSLQQISFLVRHHHERYDGRGYPDGKKGNEIEVGARILAVADSFDAMTTDRPYRKALTLKQATDELVKCKGGQFDPLIVDCFIRILEKDPGLLQG